MGKSQETFNKKQKEKKRLKDRQDKEEKAALRKANSNKGKGFESMIAYIDENGNISDTPPDPKKKKVHNTEDIQIGVPKQEDMRDVVRTGVVTFFNVEKGYGFIKDDETKDGVFVHINSVEGTIKDHDKVSFKVEENPKGLQAVSVKIITT